MGGLSKTVRLELLDPLPVDGGVRLQLRRVATGVSGQLFPALDADLDITAVDEQRCALSITAVYTPPLGAAGAGIDRLLLHRAARATMRSLLRGLGRSLTDPSPAAEPRAERLRLGPVRFFPTAPDSPIAEVGRHRVNRGWLGPSKPVSQQNIAPRTSGSHDPIADHAISR